MTKDAQTTRDETLVKFLREEIANQQKRNRTSWIAGLVVLALIWGYLTYVGSFIRNHVLNPTHAAQWVAYMTSENFPVVLSKTERSLRDQAPELCDKLVGSLVSVPRYVGEEARKQIDVVADDMLPQLEAELSSALLAYIDSHADDAQEFFAQQQEPGMVEAFVNQLTADVIADLDAEMIRDSGHGVNYVIDSTLGALEAIDQQLETLSTKSPEDMTREELLHKELIVLCLRVLDDLLEQQQASGEPLLDVTASL
jgi:hypothetical protein